MNSIIYFGCGIGFAYLLKVLKSKKNKDFKCGDEDVCSNCKFHSVVIDSISEVKQMSTIDELGNGLFLQGFQVLIGLIGLIVGILAAKAFSFWKW